MKKRHAMLFAAVALLLCSCIPSINPFYAEKDRVSNAALPGEWEGKSGSSEKPEIWKFEKGDTNSYKLTVTEEKGQKGEFIATLFKLKQETFLDLIPADCDFPESQSGLIAVSMTPGHLLVRAQFEESKLKLTFMDFDWLGKYLEAHPDDLANHVERNHMALTANTRDLQHFVLKHLNDLFKEPHEMTRCAPSAAPSQPQ